MMASRGALLALLCEAPSPSRAGPGRPGSRWGAPATRSPTGRWRPTGRGRRRCSCQGRAADRPPLPTPHCRRRRGHRGSRRARPPSSRWCGSRARAPAAGWPAPGHRCRENEPQAGPPGSRAVPHPAWEPRCPGCRRRWCRRGISRGSPDPAAARPGRRPVSGGSGRRTGRR